MELPFATGYYVDENLDSANIECTNVIPETYSIDGVQKNKLRQPQGITLFTTAGTKLSRGSWVLDEIAYEVAGNTLYRINSDGTNTDLGTISGSGRVSMASSVLELCIVVPGVAGYIYSVAGGLTAISDATYLANLSLQVTFKDGYFLHVTTAKFFKSNLNDGLTYDALDFAAAESLPDKIVGVHVSRNQAYIPGVETIEKFQSIGGSGFPYQRVTGSTIPMGVKAKFSLIDFAQTFAFVGGAKNEIPSVYLFTGSVPEKIASPAVDKIMKDHTDDELKAIFCTTHSEGGGIFLNVHFKNRTMTYDRSQGKWHERTSKDANGKQTNWRVNGIVSAYGKLLAMDNQSGRIGEFSNTVHTEYGTTVKRIFSTIPFPGQGNRISFSDLEVDCETGISQIKNELVQTELITDTTLSTACGVNWSCIGTADSETGLLSAANDEFNITIPKEDVNGSDISLYVDTSSGGSYLISVIVNSVTKAIINGTPAIFDADITVPTGVDLDIRILLASGSATTINQFNFINNYMSDVHYAPELMMSFSDDGGRTFGNETARSLGKEGEYKKRQLWRRCGDSPEHRMFRFVHDSPTRFNVYGLRANIA